MHMSQAVFLSSSLYLARMYEPKTKSANFVKIIQIYFECNSLWTNTGHIQINLLIVNTCRMQLFPAQNCLPGTCIITMK